MFEVTSDLGVSEVALRAEQVVRNLVDGAAAGQGHGEIQLFAKEGEDIGDAVLAVDDKSPHYRAADLDGVRPSRAL